MIALFLAVCMHTQADCNEVGISYAYTLPDAWGITTLYEDGHMHVQIDRLLHDKPELKAAVILHEVTHVSLLAEGYTGDPHGAAFITRCRLLSLKSGLPDLACRKSL